jgi:hypothetical protein
MSEPDDKPDEQAGSAERPSSPDAESKSVFDSDWDALLGPSASSSASRPIFAPPAAAGSKAPPAAAGSKEQAPSVELPPADPAPRTSDARASVSGAFVAPTPRPEPTTPPRYEPPEGVSPEFDNADDVTEDHLPILPPPNTRTQDDDDDDDAREELAEIIELAAKVPKPRDDSKPRARSPEPPLPSEPEPGESDGSSRNVVILGVILGVMAIGLICVLAVFGLKSKSASDDQRDSATKTAPKPTPTTRPRKPALEPELSATDEGSPIETDTGESGETDTGETGETSEPRSSLDPRDPSLIPPGTPDENAKAFSKLPVSIHDGPPIGGIGRTGVHIDAISTSRGRNNTDCDNPTETFSLASAKYVNVCFRVVHPREQESLRVIWEKDGKVTRRGRVRIPDLHAYTTRAYLLLRPEYVGSWRVRIIPEDDDTVDLAVAEFVVTE